MIHSGMRSKFTGVFGVFVLTVLMVPNAFSQRFDWMPPQATDSNSRSDNGGVEDIIPEVTYTEIPKATATKSKFKKKYTIDIKKYKISNDGTNPVETSKGINAALQYAKKAKKNYITFPKGTYLISEKDPIILNHQNTIVDLGGATLQINTNGLKKYSIMKIVKGAYNLRLTNGTIKGDRYDHDYKTLKGTHEWGTGLHMISGKNLEIDHITFMDCMGDGVGISTSGADNREELLANIFHSIWPKHLEQGAFTKKGKKLKSTEKLRSIKPFDISKTGGEFEVGYLGGYQGYPFIKGRVYQLYFYDPSMRFIKKERNLQYRKIQVPKGAKFVNLEFNQPSIPTEPAHYGATKGSWILRINNFKPSTDVHFHHNKLINNRRLGMAICGGQRWIIENNYFEGNKGTAPAYAIDFEDGWELMQDIVVRKNKFVKNGGDVVVCAGSQLVIEDNDFTKTVSFGARTHNYIARNNRYNGNGVIYSTRTGIATIEGNQYKNCGVTIKFDTKAVADGLYREKGQTVSTPPLTLKNEIMDGVRVKGTYFNIQYSKLKGAKFTAGKTTQYIHFEKNKHDNVSIEYEKGGPQISVNIEKCVGKIKEKGDGLARKGNNT